MKTIVMASGNAGKIREIAHLLAGLDVEIVPQSELGVADADETGKSFEENAIIKARHAAAATGLPAIADDSGLAVHALHGSPGVYSARFAGRNATDDENIDKLMRDLEGVVDRTAAFHCAACFVNPPDDAPVLAHGTWHGEILRERRGSGGFGYDPVFFDPTTGKTSAELSPDEKNARSHRGQALRKLGVELRARFDE